MPLAWHQQYQDRYETECGRGRVMKLGNAYAPSTYKDGYWRPVTSPTGKMTTKIHLQTAKQAVEKTLIGEPR